MPIEDLAEPVLRGLFRIVGEFVFEILIRGAGYLLIKYGWYLGRRAPDPDGVACVVVGLLFWGAVVSGVVLIVKGLR